MSGKHHVALEPADVRSIYEDALENAFDYAAA